MYPLSDLRHVLVVDDEAAICDALQMALEADGTCRVSTALNAEDAIASVAKDRPHVALVDAVLPRTSGLVLTQHLVGWGVPVLVMTGEPRHERELRQMGVHCLIKPVRVAQIISETRVLLDEAAQRMAQLRAGLAQLSRARAAVAALLDESRALVERVRAEREARAMLAPAAELWDRSLEEAAAATDTGYGTLQIADARGETLHRRMSWHSAALPRIFQQRRPRRKLRLGRRLRTRPSRRRSRYLAQPAL